MNKYLRFVTGIMLVAGIVLSSIALQPVGYRRDQLSMLVVCGGQIDCEQHQRNVQGAVKWLHDHNIYITWDEGPRFEEEVYSPWLGFEGIGIIVQRAIWRRLITGNVKKDYDIINLALPFRSRFPYLPWEGGILGLADGICTVPSQRNSIALSKQTGDIELDRQTIEHEILHLLGAPHAKYGIMAATASDPASVEFMAKDTRQFVDKCLRRPWR